MNYGRTKKKLHDACEALLAARYMLLQASAVFEDEGMSQAWRTRAKKLDRDIERVLDYAAGLGNV